MSLINRLLKANPSAQVSEIMTGAFAIPSSKNAYSASLDRGFFMGGASYDGATTTNYSTIDYITISSTGNTTSFGDLNLAHGQGPRGFSSTSRIVVGAGAVSASTDYLKYFTNASAGEMTDFGKLTGKRQSGASGSNGVKGIHAGGYDSTAGTADSAQMDSINIATVGNATSFGSLSGARRHLGGASSPTQIMFGMGEINPGGASNILDYVIFATNGNAVDFGDASASRTDGYNGSSSPTRGIWAGGYSGGDSSVIDYVNFASKGNATSFGNLITARYSVAATSNQTRSVIGGGYQNKTSMEYVTIATTGNGTSFGTITSGHAYAMSAISDCHGGLYSYLSGDQSTYLGQGLGMTAGGNNGTSPNVSAITLFDMTTTGNAVAFGSLSSARRGQPAGMSSATRAVFAGGYISGATSAIEYVQFATQGNSTSFGSLATALFDAAGTSSTGRGYIMGGEANGANISYITVATLGNSTSFGSLTASQSDGHALASSTKCYVATTYTTAIQANIEYFTASTSGSATSFGSLTVARQSGGAASNSTRGIWGGGSVSGGASNVIDYITLATAGNATDFGDLTGERTATCGMGSPNRALIAGGQNTAGTRTSTVDYITLATTGNAVTFGALGSAYGDAGSTSSAHGGI